MKNWTNKNASFTKLIGVELNILSNSGQNAIALFVYAAISLIGVLFITFLSLEYAFSNIFSNLFFEIIISAFITYLFGNIYLLIIHSVSKDTISKDEGKKYFNLPNLSRLGFIVFMAFVISKPVEVFLLNNQLKNDINSYKDHLFNNNKILCDQLYEGEISKIDNQILWHKLQIESGSKVSSKEVIPLQEKRTKLIDTKNETIANIDATIQNTNFFVTKIKFNTSRHLSSWVINSLIVLLFLLPIYFLYKINTNHNYYISKSDYECDIIESKYNEFKSEYTRLFKVKYGLNITFYESFEDHPYKKVKKIILKDNNENFFNKYLSI